MHKHCGILPLAVWREQLVEVGLGIRPKVWQVPSATGFVMRKIQSPSMQTLILKAHVQQLQLKRGPLTMGEAIKVLNCI